MICDRVGAFCMKLGYSALTDFVLSTRYPCKNYAFIYADSNVVLLFSCGRFVKIGMTAHMSCMCMSYSDSFQRL